MTTIASDRLVAARKLAETRIKALDLIRVVRDVAALLGNRISEKYPDNFHCVLHAPDGKLELKTERKAADDYLYAVRLNDHLVFSVEGAPGTGTPLLNVFRDGPWVYSLIGLSGCVSKTHAETRLRADLNEYQELLKFTPLT